MVHITALLLSIINLTTTPVCLLAFSPTSASNTQLSALRVLPFFCAEADIQQINNINIEDDDSISTSNELLEYDRTSARGWMECIEQMEGPKFGVGAYTVLRCDATSLFVPSSSSSNSNRQDTSNFDCEWKIWGEKFHMDRLSTSFKTLTENIFGATTDYHQQIGSFSNNGGSSITSMSGTGSSVHTESMFTKSIEETTHVMNKLLEHASRSICSEMQLAQHNSYNNLQNESLTQTLMVTILWTPSKQSIGSGGAVVTPLVRGHAVFSGTSQLATANIIDASLLPTPITACLAIPNQLTPEALSALPRRHGMGLNYQRQVGASASAKISSWCRIRRSLEDPSKYKSPDVGEVILLRKPDTERGTNIMTYSNENFIDTLELLEGLISNLFVVYRDGTVRTAPVGLVLPGYARHLIIQELNERGLKVDSSKPPTMQDMRDGLWSEVFVTSAIRLVIPVERIVMPASDGNLHILWEAPNDVEYESYRATTMIKSAIYQRGCSQASEKYRSI